MNRVSEFPRYRDAERRELTTDYTNKHGWGKENLAWMHKMNRIWEMTLAKSARRRKEKAMADRNVHPPLFPATNYLSLATFGAGQGARIRNWGKAINGGEITITIKIRIKIGGESG